MTLPILARLSGAALLLYFFSAAANEPQFTNPILRGGYPDPSICHDGNAWYLVNSSFEYFPGLPVHRSTDLVNWALVGYGLDREEQVTGAVNLVDVQSDGGIHAPTIRCRDGRYYIITTNVYTPPGEGQVTQFVNFVITAENPAGPWSKPKVLEGAPGIDPDLFFDDDGRVWYVGTHSPENPNFPGEGEIWLQEIDPERWTLVGPRHFLWRGACGGVWAEGPHLYKHDGRYYLLIAEGGTSFDHAVMVAVSDSVTGPYRSNPRNPVLTARHLSYDHWVNSTGHGDLFQLPDGRWYMVLLGIRGDEQRRSNMGRETHLVPVIWEREPYEWKDEKIAWPVVAPLSGRVERHLPLPFPSRPQRLANRFIDGFDSDALGLEWNFRRLPSPGAWSLTERPGYLRLFALPGVIRERGQAALLGVRQQESDFSYSARMQFLPRHENSEAGLLLFQKDDSHIAFTVRNSDTGPRLRLVLAARGESRKVVAEQALDSDPGGLTLHVVSGESRYRFAYATGDAVEPRTFAELPADLMLSHGYTGAYLGVYATANGVAHDPPDHADFDRVEVEYRPRR